MLYRKKMEPSCAYCRYGSVISPEEVICSKKGVVDSDGRCHRFAYDPLKREPAHPQLLNQDRFSPEDYEL